MSRQAAYLVTRPKTERVNWKDLEAQHQLEVLDGSTAGAFAQVI
jgi:hypothetical protein